MHRLCSRWVFFRSEIIVNGKIFITSGLNLQGKINSCKFQLIHGSYPNLELQGDFREFGADNFVFEIIDHLEPEGDPEANYTEDLKMLEEMWIDKLGPFDDKGYNRRKAAR